MRWGCAPHDTRGRATQMRSFELRFERNELLLGCEYRRFCRGARNDAILGSDGIRLVGLALLPQQRDDMPRTPLRHGM